MVGRDTEILIGEAVMPLPSDKSDQVENVISFFGQIAGHKRDRHAAILTDQCVACNRKAESFTDKISEREYRISGLCQVCQDEIFGAS